MLIDWLCEIEALLGSRLRPVPTDVYGTVSGTSLSPFLPSFLMGCFKHEASSVRLWTDSVLLGTGQWVVEGIDSRTMQNRCDVVYTLIVVATGLLHSSGLVNISQLNIIVKRPAKWSTANKKPGYCENDGCYRLVSMLCSTSDRYAERRWINY